MMPPLTPQQQQATTSPTDLVLGIGIVIGVAYLAGKLFIGYRKVVPAAQKISIRTAMKHLKNRKELGRAALHLYRRATLARR